MGKIHSKDMTVPSMPSKYFDGFIKKAALAMQKKKDDLAGEKQQERLLGRGAGSRQEKDECYSGKH